MEIRNNMADQLESAVIFQRLICWYQPNLNNWINLLRKLIMKGLAMQHLNCAYRAVIQDLYNQIVIIVQIL